MHAPESDASGSEVRLLAGKNRSGGPVLELVPAHPLEPAGQHRLTGSPLLALGAAAGDVVAVAGDGSFEVLKRGGNLAVQVFLEREEGSENGLAALAQRVEALGGRLDGGADRGRVYTIPVSAGFPGVEAAFNALLAELPGAEWFFGNVYDPADEATPLNWW